MLFSKIINPYTQLQYRQQKDKVKNHTSTGSVPLARAPRHHFDSQRTALTAGFLTFSRLMTCIYICVCVCVCRTVPLTSRRYNLYIYSTNIRTKYFKHAAHSPFFHLQNAVYFITLPFLVPVLFTF
jgi:hypothetical protein